MGHPRADSFEIRSPRAEDFHEIVAIADLGFGEETSAEDEQALRRSFPWERALCAYESGRVVGTLAVYSMELTVPGRRALPVGAATWGGTLPTHRRRGILRALFRAQLEDMVARGEPVAVLLASEAGIYRRFGFGPATAMMSFSLDRAWAGLAEPYSTSAPEGMTLVADVDAAGRLAAIYESLRLTQPGALSRSATWWAHHLRDPLIERQGATKMYHAVHTRPDGTAGGYVSYRVKEQWSASTPMYDVIVVELVAGDADSYKALWHYIINTDLCQTISSWRGRIDEPLRWMLADSRRLAVNALADDLYVRLLDIPRALAAREYSTSGRLVLEVAESFPTVRTGRYVLRSEGLGGRAECAPTEAEPDLCMSVDALGAAYLGGVSFTTLAAAGRVTATDARALRAADGMFSTGIAPYCCTMF
jgi:predicted acetyltransferase